MGDSFLKIVLSVAFHLYLEQQAIMRENAWFQLEQVNI